MKKNIVIAVLILAFLFTWGYLLWNNNRVEQVQQSQQTQIAKTTDEKGALQKNFDDALVRLDSLTGTNNKLQQQLIEADMVIARNKSEIRSILAKKRPASGTYEGFVSPNAIKIPVYYGTDRKSTGSRDFYEHFSGEPNIGKPYQTGVVEVSIPIRKHVIGYMEQPAWFNFLADRRDTSKYFVITGLVALDYATFYSSLKQAVDESGDKELFIFIHGFKNSFAEAAERTAQLTYDLGFRGVPVLYSWSSGGALAKYDGDEENVRSTVGTLKQFLLDIIDRTHAKKINLIAHSMGTRAVTDVLKDITLEKGTVFNEVILAAADIFADEFRTNVAPNIIGKCHRITLYASSGDRALKSSELLHSGHVRVGEGGEHIFTMAGMETVDASDLQCADFFDHSYFLESRPLIDDIRQLFYFDAKPEARNLIFVHQGSNSYWSFKK